MSGPLILSRKPSPKAPMRPTNQRLPFPRPGLWAVSLLAAVILTQPGLAQEPAPAAVPVLAIVAGSVHPVDAPTLENGVVLIRGDRIVAVGKKGELEIPADAQVLDYPQGHIYPGLVDALSDAFTDDSVRRDGSQDAATELALALRLRHDSQDELIRSGVTTAYVGSRAPGTWRGIGVLVRPTRDSFDRWAGHLRAGLQAKLGGDAAPSHPLQRQQAIDGFGKAFDGLEAYAKTLTDHDEALAKYKKEFEAYLEHFKKQNPEAKTEAKPDPSTPREGAGGGQRGGNTAPTGERRGRRGGRQGEGGGPAPQPQPPQQRPVTPPPQAPASGAKPGEENKAEAKKADEKKAEDKPPARPTWPKPPSRDPVKDALLEVLDGRLTLRLEVQRADEITNALAMAASHKVPAVVLEGCWDAAAVVDQLARSGATCVLTDVVPGAMPKVREFETLDPVALPAALQQAGVGFAIASGSAARAGGLRLMAASAIGAGLDADSALRAITLSPARILGVQQETGSLTAGKLADLLVCDRPLFASDCRILRVLSGGQTQYEAK